MNIHLAIQVPLGLFTVLFIPGNLLSFVLFPDSKELKGLERIGVSLGASLVLSPLIALCMYYLSGSLNQINIVLAYSLSIWVLAAVAYQRIRINEHPNVQLRLFPDMPKKEAAIALGFLLLISVISLAVYQTQLAPKRDNFLDFTLLDANGLTKDYSVDLIVGKTYGYDLEIVNHHGKDLEVSISRSYSASKSTVWGPTVINDGEKIVVPTSFTPASPSDKQKLEFELYVQGISERYANVYLWVRAVSMTE